MSIKTCNNCAVRNCKLVSDNNYPMMAERPRKRNDHMDASCSKYLPINRTIPLECVAHGGRYE